MQHWCLVKLQLYNFYVSVHELTWLHCRWFCYINVESCYIVEYIRPVTSWSIGAGDGASLRARKGVVFKYYSRRIVADASVTRPSHGATFVGENDVGVSPVSREDGLPCVHLQVSHEIDTIVEHGLTVDNSYCVQCMELLYMWQSQLGRK